MSSVHGRAISIIAMTCFLVLCSVSLVAIDSQDAFASSKTARIKLSAVGDCLLFNNEWGQSRFNDCFNQNGPNYFFSKVKGIFSNDDVTIANLEGTFTESTNKKKKRIHVKGPSKYAKILKVSSIEVVNLANNHSRDFLAKGLKDTKRALKAKKISYCFKTTISYRKVKGVKMAFLGFNRAEIETFTRKQIQDGINRAKKRGAQIIVVSLHWGNERRYTPNNVQRTLGRFAIDCGASLVLGHHPHVLQGIEKYKGRCIVYSLGNFCFGGDSNPYDKDTMIFQQTFTVKQGKLTNSLNAKVIPCMISGNREVNDFQPCVPSEKKYRQQVMSKIKALCALTGTSVKFNGKIS